MAVTLNSVGGLRGGDVLRAFLAVGHNEDGTNIGGGGGSFPPDQWTVGPNGELFIQPDADVVNLTLKAAVGQTANQLEVYDESGTIVAQIEFDGGFSNFNAFRVSPFVFTTGVQIGIGGAIFQKLAGGDAWTAEVSGNTFMLLRTPTAFGSAIFEVIRAQNQVGLYINSSGVVENPRDAIQVASSLTGNNCFRVLGAGAPVTAQNTAPADADLEASECAWWFDSTNGASKVKFKGK